MLGKLMSLIVVSCCFFLVLMLTDVNGIAGFGNGALPRATPSAPKGQITSLIQELCQRHPGECKAILARSIRREILRLEAKRKRMLENSVRQNLDEPRSQERAQQNTVEESIPGRFQENELDKYSN